MDISYGTKFCVVFEIIWVWSEFNGKHEGCKYWSKEACKVWEQQKPSREGLIHEHLVPRKILIDKLLNDNNLNQKEIFAFLEKFCIGVVVTKDEDQTLNNKNLRSKMPDNWDGKDPWARYTEANLDVERQN